MAAASLRHLRAHLENKNCNPNATRPNVSHEDLRSRCDTLMKSHLWIRPRLFILMSPVDLEQKSVGRCLDCRMETDATSPPLEMDLSAATTTSTASSLPTRQNHPGLIIPIRLKRWLDNINSIGHCDLNLLTSC